MSKYDKSQGREALLFECKLMRAFGVPEYFITVWKYAHEFTVLKDFSNGVTLQIMYQRKSGDPSTYVGNTTFLMAVLSMLADFINVVIAAFSGDDSFIRGRNLKTDYNKLCALLFNLDSKFITCYKHTYFCSKFIVRTEDKTYFVPDPIKLITKLGRSDLVNWDHVEDYRNSVLDLVQCYGDWRLYEPLTEAFNERYACRGKHNMVYSTLYHIGQTAESFNTLYFVDPKAKLNLDPSRPVADIDYIKRNRKVRSSGSLAIDRIDEYTR